LETYSKKFSKYKCCIFFSKKTLAGEIITAKKTQVMYFKKSSDDVQCVEQKEI